MTRRGGELPWGTRRSSPGFGGRRQPDLPRIAMLAAIVLGVALLAGFVFSQLCTSSGCDEAYCVSGRDITPPEGYERVTSVYEFNEEQGPIPDGQDLRVSLELKSRTDDPRNLSFYRYVEETGTWEPLVPATLDESGKIVTGTLSTAPSVMTVMRRLSPAGHVVAYLPSNAQLHPEAQGQVTIVHTRDYRPISDGTIEGSKSELQLATGVAWYPTIWASAAEQGAIPIVSGILSSAPSRTTHVQHIVQLVEAGQFDGIDIAYLDLPSTERTNFTLFIAELADALHRQQKVLTLTLPPPQRATDRIDEGAYDWAQLGQAADLLQIAPYRDQGKFRQVMPELLNYLTGVVDPAKLVLTVSPYATETSAEGVRTMTLTDAMVIAAQLQLRAGSDGRIETNSNVEVVGVNIDKEENLTGISWSTDAASVYFTYKQGTGRTVFIENFFSLGFKLELIPQFGLGGLAVEDASANELLGNIWPALNPFIASGQPILLQPNPADLAPQWEVSGGEKEGGQRGSIRWATPAQPGQYTVRLTLSDGVALFQNETTVEVQAKQTPGTTPGSSG